LNNNYYVGEREKEIANVAEGSFAVGDFTGGSLI
jgi:hypothetical protein